MVDVEASHHHGYCRFVLLGEQVVSYRTKKSYRDILY